MHIGADIIEEAAFLRRTETHDELWTIAGLGLAEIGNIAAGNASLEAIEYGSRLTAERAYAVPRQEEEDLAAGLNLLYRLFRARVGLYWPTGFVAAGLVNESAFNSLVGGPAYPAASSAS